MKIAVIASGSRGDVQPYVALGQGLAEAGHRVRLVTHQDYEALVTAQGLALWPIAGKVQEIAQSPEMRARLAKGNFLGIMAQMAKEAEHRALALAEEGLAACQGVDLILTGLGGLYMGQALAEKLALPLLQAYYIPFTPTGAYPSFLFPRLPAWLGGLFNRLSYHLARQVMWQGFRSADRRVRQQVLGLPASPFWGPYGALHPRRYPILYGYSPAVIPPAPDWDENIHVTGYWFLEPDGVWTPPPALVEFLAAGPPPVYVGFGSMSDGNPEETAALVVQALAQAGQRGIILSGWGGLRLADVPASVFVLESAPFAWLFPQVAAVVHHGGAGTTAAGLRAGVPSLVIPFMGDQPFWGQRVAELGVGPQPLPRKRLTVERLASAIEEAVTDPTMRQRAADLGAEIQAEDGVARAVAVVNGFGEAGAARRRLS